ncbi:MAG: hypothetical protein KF809_17280 [Chloroflexi bacterium]|nr:hypothetical protein [Chloroflexota bacterium]
MQKPTTGLELRLERVALDVKVKDVAAAMGAPASSVSRLEKMRQVTEASAARYRDALARCAAVATSEVAA